MPLRHDAQGFLQGEPIELGKMLITLHGLRSDVRTIQRALGIMARRNPGAQSGAAGVQGGNPNPATVGASGTRVPATPTGRDSRGRFIRREATGSEGVVTPGRRMARPAAGAVNLGDAATPGPRNVRGQFAGGDGSSSDSEGGDDAFRGFVDRLTGAINGNALEGTDPAVKAFQEVAQPLAAGYGMLTGNREEKRKEGWFRRIYGTLAGFRKDESLAGKATNKSLKNLEEKPAGDGGSQGGISGFLGGIAGRVLPLLGLLLTRLLPMVAGAIGAWSVGKWIGEKLYAWMDERGINTIIFNAFDGMKAYVSKGWDGAMSLWNDIGRGVGKAWDFVMNLFSRAYEALKELPVIGTAIKAAESAAAKVKEVAVSAVESTKQVVTDAAASTRQEAKTAVDSAKQAASDTAAGVKQAYPGEKPTTGERSLPMRVGEVVGGAAKSIVDSAKQAASDVAAGVKQAYSGEKPATGERSLPMKAGELAGGAAKSVADAANRAYSAAADTANSVLMAVMPKGYRGKATFEGVKGGAGLAKNGSYTKDEAEKIRELRASGANTSADLKGGMPIEIQDKISAQAKKYGLDPVMMQKIAAMESGGNAQAISSTGAIGIYQFTGKTASGVGIQDRFDVDQNIEGGMRLTQQNMAALKAAGLPVNAENLYMMHQLGPAAAKEVIRGAASGKSKSDLSAETRAGMNLNYSSGSKTASDYLSANKSALDKRYASVVGSAAARAPAAPQVAHAPAPKAPAISAPPPIADAPPVINPLSAGSSKTQIKVTMPAQDVGQDIKERRIALTTTGGLSAG